MQFGGGCQGCGQSQVTLSQGIETAILADVPEIKRVLDGTDHASGANPYYQGGG
ncbi:MAG: NifU family protein [Candidatus Sulfomarinibacteraceae bacterium]